MVPLHENPAPTSLKEDPRKIYHFIGNNGLTLT
jgi:hypothetical protein